MKGQPDMAAIVPILLPGNMCDSRLWPDTVRNALPGAIDLDTALDDTIDGMASRALDLTAGMLLPVGFSMGAIVGLAMAKRAPNRIAGAMLIGLNAGADLPDRAAHRPSQQAEVRAGGLERVLVKELKPNYLATKRRSDVALLDLLRDMGLALGPDVFVRQSEALRTRPDLIPVLAALDVPVALLCGAEDALCPPAWHERWCTIAKDATVTVAAACGHMLPLEAPDLLAAELIKFRERIAA